MHLRRLSVKNLKLLRDLRLSFTHPDGSPRQWTVFVGENGLCKTSLLQAIALAASGPERANQLAADAVPLMRDKRPALAPTVHIEAEFGFGPRFHSIRFYPGLDDAQTRDSPPRVLSTVTLEPFKELMIGSSRYLDEEGRDLTPMGSPGSALTFSPLSDARARENIGHWFVGGYGVGRRLPTPLSLRIEERSRVLDRLRSLFEPAYQIVGTEFASRFSPEETHEFVKLLKEALVEKGILPRIEGLELRGRGGITRSTDLVEAHRFDQVLGPSARVRLPAAALSHGYQSTIALVADLIGQVMLETERAAVPLEDMEGIVLIDEIDLHLHPLWQRQLVPSLSRAFPNIQFIATTHSPMILPGLKADEIVRLTQNDAGDVEAETARVSPRLMTGSEIYDAFFDIQRVESDELRTKIEDYGRIAMNPYRTDEDERQMLSLVEELEKEGVAPRWRPSPRRPLSTPPEPQGDHRS